MNNQDGCRRGSCKLQWRCVNKDADDPWPGPPAGSPRPGRTGRRTNRTSCGCQRGQGSAVLCVCQLNVNNEDINHSRRRIQTNPAVRWKMLAQMKEAKLRQHFRRRWHESTSWKNKSVALLCRRQENGESAGMAMALALTALNKPSTRITRG